MDFINLLLKKYPLLLILAVLVFYFLRTAPVDLTKDAEINTLIKQELQTRRLKKMVHQANTQAEIEQIENDEVVIDKLIGKYSASAFVTNVLFLKVTFHTNFNSKSEVVNYQIRYDLPSKRWYVRQRELTELTWKVAI